MTHGNQMQPKEKDLQLFSIFTGIFVTVLVLIPATSSKIFAIGPFNLPGGTLVFPITFIFNDILTEVYGYARSRRIIWTGLGCQVLAALTYLIVGILPPASFWPHQQAYEVILGFAPRVAIASLLAYFCGEFANSIVISKMKYKAGGKRGLPQGWRFVASTIVGEAVDTVVFMLVAFLGIIPPTDLVYTLITLYVVKVIYEIAALPFSTRVANWVKKVEGIDQIDDPRTTHYNPFVIFFKPKANRTTGDSA